MNSCLDLSESEDIDRDGVPFPVSRDDCERLTPVMWETWPLLLVGEGDVVSCPVARPDSGSLLDSLAPVPLTLESLDLSLWLLLFSELTTLQE